MTSSASAPSRPSRSSLASPCADHEASPRSHRHCRLRARRGPGSGRFPATRRTGSARPHVGRLHRRRGRGARCVSRERAHHRAAARRRGARRRQPLADRPLCARRCSARERGQSRPRDAPLRPRSRALREHLADRGRRSMARASRSALRDPGSGRRDGAARVPPRDPRVLRHALRPGSDRPARVAAHAARRVCRCARLRPDGHRGRGSLAAAAGAQRDVRHRRTRAGADDAVQLVRCRVRARSAARRRQSSDRPRERDQRRGACVQRRPGGALRPSLRSGRADGRRGRSSTRVHPSEPLPLPRQALHAAGPHAGGRERALRHASLAVAPTGAVPRSGPRAD